MKLRARYAIVLLAAFAGGCGTARAWLRASSTPADFFPLRPGTLWVYEVHDASGSVALERVLVRGPVHLATRNAEGVIVEESGGLGGELALDVEWHPLVYYRRDRFLYKFSAVDYESGALREIALGEGEEKVLPDDPGEHHAWQSEFEIFHGDEGSGSYRAHTNATASRSERPLRTRAGTFAGCLRVESEIRLASSDADLGFRYVDWYAPHVGLVRSEVRATGDDRLVTTLELVSFRAGGSER